ncbi:hypothetical protein [Archaeoglobus sp.]
MGEIVKRVKDRTEEVATELNNIIFIGLYIGLNKVLGEGAKGLGAYVGREILKLMKDKYGLNFEGSDDPQVLLDRFTRVMINDLGFAEQGEIDVQNNDITLKLKNPMDLPVLKRLISENIAPAIYPMAYAVLAAIYDFSGKKAIVKDIIVEDDNVTVKMKIVS